jgi:hypothetical protein
MSEVFLCLFCGAVAVLAWSLVRHWTSGSRPQDGHDRAAIREQEWYGLRNR